MKKLTLAILQVSTISALLLATSVQAVENTTTIPNPMAAPKSAARLDATAIQKIKKNAQAQMQAELVAIIQAQQEEIEKQNSSTTSIEYHSQNTSNDIVLTSTQEQAVKQLTEASLQMINLGQIIDNQGGITLHDSLSQQSCLNNFLTSEGYHQYQHDRAVKYVISKTPTQLQQDLQILTPQVASAFRTFRTDFKIVDDPYINLSMYKLMYDSSFQDLRKLLNFNLPVTITDDAAIYLSWAMKQCNVSLDDLNTSK